MFFSEFTHTVLSRKRCDLDTFFLGEEEEGEKNHLFAESNASFLLRFFPFPLPGNRDVRHIFLKKEERDIFFFWKSWRLFWAREGEFYLFGKSFGFGFCSRGGPPSTEPDIWSRHTTKFKEGRGRKGGLWLVWGLGGGRRRKNSK